MGVCSLSPHQECVSLIFSGNFWNGGEFYGPPNYNSLVLLKHYLEKYPEDAGKIMLSIKGGVNPHTHASDGSAENTRRTIDDSTAQLNGRKKIDLFEFARRDQGVSMSETFGVMDKEYVQTGKIGGVSLSEVRAETIHEAVKHVKIHAVEVELSLYVTHPVSGTTNPCSMDSLCLLTNESIASQPRSLRTASQLPVLNMASPSSLTPPSAMECSAAKSADSKIFLKTR